MSQFEMLLALIAMSITIFVCRALPLILPKRWLTLGWLQRLNQALPLCIMIILLLSNLHFPNTLQGDYANITAELMAILTTLLSYIWLRNVLLSVIIGVVTINCMYFSFSFPF